MLGEISIMFLIYKYSFEIENYEQINWSFHKYGFQWAPLVKPRTLIFSCSRLAVRIIKPLTLAQLIITDFMKLGIFQSHTYPKT